jgi:hypothetical protein
MSEGNGQYATFKKLVETIFESGVHATKLIEGRSLSMFQELYFNKDGTPKTTKVGDQEIANIALVNHQSLTIDELVIDFEVELGEVHSNDNDEEQNAKHDIHCDTAGAHTHRRLAKCSIKFKGGDPPEGIARINNQLVKLIHEH